MFQKVPTFFRFFCVVISLFEQTHYTSQYIVYTENMLEMTE